MARGILQYAQIAMKKLLWKSNRSERMTKWRWAVYETRKFSAYFKTREEAEKAQGVIEQVKPESEFFCKCVIVKDKAKAE